MNSKRAAAMIAIKADDRTLKADLSRARKTLRAFGSDTRKIGGKIWGAGKGALKSLAGGIGLSAGMGLSEMVGDVLDYNRALTRFQVAAKKTDAEMAAMGTSITDVSRATAISRDEILGGLQTYVDLTGDVAGAGAAMSSFARIAQASGSKVSDVATATAALQVAMKLDPSQVEAVFSGLITQGEKGAVSLKDFAGELAELAPQFATFAGGTGADGIRDMGAAFQVIRTGAGSANTAATQFQALMSELVAKSKELGAIGIKVFGKGGKLRGFSEIADDLASNKMLDNVAVLQNIFKREEAQKAVRSIRDQIGAMHELGAAGRNTTAVQDNLNTVLNSSTGRVDVAVNNLKLSLAETFTPERIQAFASALENVAKVFGGIVDAAETLFGHVAGDSGYTSFQEKQLDKFASGLTDREKQFLTANIGPGGILQGIGEGTVTESSLQAGLLSRQLPPSLVEKIREHQRMLRDNQTRLAISESGAARMAVEAGQQGPGRAVVNAAATGAGAVGDTLAAIRALGGEIRSAIRDGLREAKVEVKADGSAIAKTVGNAQINRGGGW